MSLPPRQQRFADEWLVDMNATRACIAAGYTKNEKAAAVQGHQLLRNPKVAEYIATAQAKRAERVQVTADRTLSELATIGFSNICDFFQSEDGRLYCDDLKKLPPEAQRCIKSIKQVESERLSPDGGEPLKTRRVEVELWPKVQALQLIMKHLGMDAPTQHEVKHTVLTRAEAEAELADAVRKDPALAAKLTGGKA